LRQATGAIGLVGGVLFQATRLTCFDKRAWLQADMGTSIADFKATLLRALFSGSMSHTGGVHCAVVTLNADTQCIVLNPSVYIASVRTIVICAYLEFCLDSSWFSSHQGTVQ